MAEFLRASTMGRPVKVDRKGNALRGYVVAQMGPFKSTGRGEFNQAGLQQICDMGNGVKQGLKSRLNHATMCSDGLGNHLGRSKDFFMSECMNADGQMVPCVRADLMFDPTALEPTPGNQGKAIANYVMDLAESDPGAISSSLVIKPKKEYRMNPDGTLVKDANGEPLPPLWYPEKLLGSDIVDTGDAVDDLLSVEGLAHGELYLGTDLLDGMFQNQGRDEIAGRLHSWVERYLDHRFDGIEILFVHNSVVADGEPDWGSVDKTALPRLAFADMGDEGKKSTWSYPHHWVRGGTKKDESGVWEDGTLFLHRGGLNAAWEAAMGARSGQKASQAVIDHLQRHRRALGITDAAKTSAEDDGVKLRICRARNRSMSIA